MVDKEVKKVSKLEDDTDMIIESSEDLEVVKSFDELGLRDELLRGIPFIDYQQLRHLCVRIQQTLSCPTKGYSPHHQRQRRHHSESEWNR